MLLKSEGTISHLHIQYENGQINREMNATVKYQHTPVQHWRGNSGGVGWGL